MQGRPLNVNDEAACFIGKTGGGVEKGALRLKLGGESMHFSMEDQKYGGNWRGFASLLQGGMDAPGLSHSFCSFFAISERYYSV